MARLNRLGTGLLITIILILSACASTPKSIEVLDETLKNYKRSLSWGEYRYCLTMHGEKEVNEEILDRLKSIKVTGYEVQKFEVAPDNQSAEQTVEIKYYNRAVSVVRSMVVEQHWKYLPQPGVWINESPFPEFK